MYTFKLPIFVSRSDPAGSLSPVSTQNAFAVCCTPEGCTVPLGFLYGGFTSTAGYVPGNEARDLSISSGFALFGPIISLKRYPFLSG